MRRSKIITPQLKSIEIQKIIDIKSVTIEHSKTTYKLIKTIRQAEKVSQVVDVNKNLNETLCDEPKKREILFWRKKIAKITKRSHAYKYYASS